MSLISFERQEDSQALRDLWDIIGIGMEAYVRTERQDILNATQELVEFAERLKERTQKHDYIVEDKRRSDVEKRLKEIYDKNF